MSLTATVETQNPEGKLGQFPCRLCRQETSQLQLAIVNSHDFSDCGQVQFWNHFLTVRCQGCGTINFCIVSSCSEEEDYDSHGRPFLAVRKTGFPPPLQGQVATDEHFISERRLDELATLANRSFDTKKLLRMAAELNSAYKAESYISSAFLIRAILDHVPPIFGTATFSEVANNYSDGGRSFKEAMLHLQNSSRKIADSHLHLPIRPTETIPNRNQVDFRPAMDVLFSEIIRIFKGLP